MHAKQERFESLNYSNDTAFLTHVYLSVLQRNKSFYLSKRHLFRRHIVHHLYYLQPIKLVEPVRLHTGAVYMEEKAVYMNNIHGKTIQWKHGKILQYYEYIYYIYIHTLYPGYCDMYYKCH